MKANKLLLAALCWVHVQVFADPGSLTRAHGLISTGKPDAALELLSPLAAEEGGNGVYHYLVGMALMDTGKLPEAIAALKRSLELDPRLVQARAELGRAYALQGDPISAYQAFKEVRSAHPPAEALAGMNRFIDGVAKRLNPARTVSGSLTLGLGYDSNVNTGTTATDVTLPLFGGVTATLSPLGQPREDGFATVAGSVSLDKPLDDRLSLVGALVGSGKFNFDGNLKSYNLATGEITGGLRHTAGTEQMSAEVGLDGLYYLDSLYRKRASVGLGWRRISELPMVDLPLELDMGLNHSYLDYPDDDARNARRTVFSAGLRPTFFGHRIQYGPQLFSVHLGKESTTHSASDHLGYKLWGLRAAYLDPIRTGLTWFVSGGVEQRRYDADDPLFLRKRDDRQIDLALGLSYDLGNAWNLVPSLQWIDNDSNIPVYEYRRTSVTMAVRRSF